MWCCGNDTGTKSTEHVEATTDAQLSPVPKDERQHFTIYLQRNSPEEKMGLDVAHKGRFLKVKAVKQGIVMAWNTAHPESQVQANDLIVDVNGVASGGEMSSQRLLEAMALVKAGPLELTFIRP
mmetsp:Transcript_78654/g.163539  ORF Transcript_78654/g.163539 Transcript_78654/m.163539 type:complete len:124 (-) Transcript_78654:3-374(-)